MRGHSSAVIINVTRDACGRITELNVDASGESPGLGQKCMEEEWLAQFIGHTGPFVLPGVDNAAPGVYIDAVSYATVTSRAIVDALNHPTP